MTTILIVGLIILGILSYLIKDEEYQNWKQNNDH